MEQEDSDIGRVWEDALDKYCKDTGTNIKYLPQMKWDVAAIMGEQTRQVEAFSQYRHDKSLTDKFRSAISRNSDVIQSVASNIANAASTAFPPSTAILTAFTYVMKASKNVSEDYDQVAAFFDIMSSMLERLSLLESKLPSAKNYKTILMRVFSSLLGLCGTATKYVMQGRFKHWLKALYKGSDEGIKGDYTLLETNIQRLESATMFATLATVMETKSDVKELTVISMQSLKVGTRTLEVGLETHNMVQDVSVAQGESLDILKKVQRILRKEDLKKQSEHDNQVVDSGAKRTAALDLIKTVFAIGLEPASQLQDIQMTFVEGTFNWLPYVENYKRFLEGDLPILWIHGPAGVGKSHAAYSLVGNLLGEVKNERRTSVTYYFFRSDGNCFRGVSHMLRVAIMQSAIKDVRYREEVAAELTRTGRDYPWHGDFESEIWDQYFVKMYHKDSDSRLIMVVDGLDEMDSKDLDSAISLFARIKKEELAIQIILTSRREENIASAILSLEPGEIEIDKAAISETGGDLWKVIMDRGKKMPKLRRLRKAVLRRLATKLRLKADSFLYLDHVLPRLDDIGKESLISKEIDRLPDNLVGLYQTLLLECQQSRSPEEFSTLKGLFAWLSHGNRTLTFGEAVSLMKYLRGSSSLNLEEEMDTRCSRILDLGGRFTVDDDDKSDVSSSIDDEDEEEALLQEASVGDSWLASPLKFHDRAMREFFCDTNLNDNDLRSTFSSAHLQIFEASVNLLNASKDEVRQDYAQFVQGPVFLSWIPDFLNVDPACAGAPEIRSILSHLFTVMDPHGQALLSIIQADRGFIWGDFFDILESPFNLCDEFLARFQVWVKLATKLPIETFSSEVRSWMQVCNTDDGLLIWLARGLVTKWFETEELSDARVAYMLAQRILERTSISPQFVEDSRGSEAEDILGIANSFPYMKKDAKAYRAIGMALYDHKHNQAAVMQFEKCLALTDSDIMRFHIYYFLSDMEFLDYYNAEMEHREKKEDLIKLYITVKKGFELYHGSKEVKGFAEQKDQQHLIEMMISIRANCEIKLDELDAAVITMFGITEIAGMSIPEDVLGQLVEALEKRGMHQKILEIVERMRKIDIYNWLSFDGLAANNSFQLAAWKCGRLDFVVETYNSILADQQYVRLTLAKFYQLVLLNYNESKKLWYMLLDEEQREKKIYRSEYMVGTSRLHLADVLTEQYRSATEGSEKISLYEEMKNLAIGHPLATTSEFNEYESQTAISFALMMPKMGGANEFQAHMDKVFRDCIDALSDDVSYNDRLGFRQLAKTLAIVPGLHRDAQIAYSLQNSEVGPDRDLSMEARQQTRETQCEDGIVEAGSSVSSEESDSTEDFDCKPEDLSSWTQTTCTGCSESFYNWDSTNLYLCIICTACDLCEKCWKKRTACKKKEDWTEWRHFCGENHKYIKGPIAGWRGTYKRIIRIKDGEDTESERIVFKDWLIGLEPKWKEAWKVFWREDELLVDIL